MLFTPRALNFFGFLACALLMAYAFYLQYVEGLEPCPLCMAQRIAVVALGIVLGLAALHNPARTGRRVYAVLTLLCALAGAALAGRQLWLQSLPEDQVPACGPGLSYMMEVFPMSEVLMMMIQGTGDCAKVDWTFLGLSIAGWTFIWFVLFGLFAIFQFVRKPAQNA